MYSFSDLETVCCSMSISNCSWSVYKFLKRQVRWSGIPNSLRIFQFVVSHTVQGFGIFNKAEIDVFLELSCFFYDPVDVSNLISGSSAFSKSTPISSVYFVFFFFSVNIHIFNSTFKISITTFKMVPNKSINGNIN